MRYISNIFLFLFLISLNYTFSEDSENITVPLDINTSSYNQEETLTNYKIPKEKVDANSKSKKDVLIDGLEYIFDCIKIPKDSSVSKDDCYYITTHFKFIGYNEIISLLSIIKDLFVNIFKKKESKVNVEQQNENSNNQYDEDEDKDNEDKESKDDDGIKQVGEEMNINMFYETYVKMFKDNNIYGDISGDDTLLDTKSADNLLLLLGDVFSRNSTLLNIICPILNSNKVNNV